ncbi:methyltransferase family protein [Sungkyunkwania multivorans]|uniref:Methyltransferase family protein n=1 Tax=Sungkyunkwania multivorans TaxID=1173618 RepID=A0ABW3D1H0_9FLAO
MKPLLKDYLYVIAQGGLLVLYLADWPLFEMPTSPIIFWVALAMIWVGILIGIMAMAQLNKNLSPFPTPKSDAQLVQTGLYKYIRHPIYTGILLAALSYAFFIGSSFKLLIFLLLLTLFYFKSKYEEKKLKLKFPDYEGYMKTTGRFLPKISAK